MLELISVPRHDVVGVRIDGKLSEDDVERCIQAIDRKFEEHERLRIYVELKSFGGIAFGALLSDLKYAFKHLRDFDRKAVVSDRRWADLAAKAGDALFSSIQVKHFAPAEREAALAWVQSDE